jgi:hypothetical protein
MPEIGTYALALEGRGRRRTDCRFSGVAVSSIRQPGACLSVRVWATASIDLLQAPQGKRRRCDDHNGSDTRPAMD